MAYQSDNFIVGLEIVFPKSHRIKNLIHGSSNDAKLVLGELMTRDPLDEDSAFIEALL